jgi:hypothetical protein
MSRFFCKQLDRHDLNKTSCFEELSDELEASPKSWTFFYEVAFFLC